MQQTLDPDFQKFHDGKKDFPYIIRYGDSIPNCNLEWHKHDVLFNMPLLLFWFDWPYRYQRFNIPDNKDGWQLLLRYVPEEKKEAYKESVITKLTKQTKKHDEFIDRAGQYYTDGYGRPINSGWHCDGILDILIFIGCCTALCIGAKFVISTLKSHLIIPDFVLNKSTNTHAQNLDVNLTR